MTNGTETQEHPGSRIVACGSTRCKFNWDSGCTSPSVKIGKGGECKTEEWGVRAVKA